mmetsp:Transcript_41872/g.87514  ORF Transcript_41872/g.87514 Transcript_41872/m.87514 type:complete len:82 (+) Transcript_41872:610-855(+)
MHSAPHSKVCALRRTRKCAPHIAGDSAVTARLGSAASCDGINKFNAGAGIKSLKSRLQNSFCNLCLKKNGPHQSVFNLRRK